MAGADAGGNARYQLSRIDGAIGTALDAVDQLRQHGDLNGLSDSVASMLRVDLETAVKRVRWLQAARDRRGAA